jgi:hypothetical protein
MSYLILADCHIQVVTDIRHPQTKYLAIIVYNPKSDYFCSNQFLSQSKKQQ